MKIILIGKAASGKDHLRKKMMDAGAVFVPSHTTRYPREGEMDGVDYFFDTKEEFLDSISRGEYLQFNEVNGEYYGTKFDDFSKGDLFIMSPNGVKALPPEIRNEVFVMYVNCPEDTRNQRSQSRGTPFDKMIKRSESDRKEFVDLKQNKLYDVVVDGYDPFIF